MTNRIETAQKPQPESSGQPPADEQKATTSGSTDIFADLAQLRLSQDFHTTCGVKKSLLSVPVRKPAKEWFVRTNSSLRSKPPCWN